MPKRITPDLIGIGRDILSAHMTVRGWWKTHDYHTMRFNFSHAVLFRSLREDLAHGEHIPDDVYKDFPELPKPYSWFQRRVGMVVYRLDERDHRHDVKITDETVALSMYEAEATMGLNWYQDRPMGHEHPIPQP